MKKENVGGVQSKPFVSKKVKMKAFPFCWHSPQLRQLKYLHTSLQNNSSLINPSRGLGKKRLHLKDFSQLFLAEQIRQQHGVMALLW